MIKTIKEQFSVWRYSFLLGNTKCNDIVAWQL
jgi:hypothetical protein